MTPQSSFMVAAPIVPAQEADLRRLLLAMNGRPGMADPNNPLVPFGQFDTLHFARFVILNDSTLGDLSLFGPEAEFPNAPTYLAFLGECDGSAKNLLADLASRAGNGLHKIFSHCIDFDPNCNLLRWMHSNSIKPSITYVNWIGRTVQQIREEAKLHEALVGYLAEYLADHSPRGERGYQPRDIRQALARAVEASGLQLTSPAPTPIGWRTRQFSLIIATAAFVLLAATPALVLPAFAAMLVYAAVLLGLAAVSMLFLVNLRKHEKTDPDVQSPPRRPTDEHLAALGALDDHDVTNQYTAMGCFKPGPFSRWTTTVIWWLVDVATPILYPRGNLARIKTIHFARWVFLDDKRRGLFTSSYDGSAESYMDDFVNKVAFGLNLTFSRGVGYPGTYFLLWGGAQREQDFKNVQRRHSLPTEVWYKAYPGLSLADMARNTRIRHGLQRSSMTEPQIRQWLSEI